MVYKTSFDEKIKRMDMVYYLMINQKVSFYFTLNSRENNTQRKISNKITNENIIEDIHEETDITSSQNMIKY